MHASIQRVAEQFRILMISIRYCGSMNGIIVTKYQFVILILIVEDIAQLFNLVSQIEQRRRGLRRSAGEQCVLQKVNSWEYCSRGRTSLQR